MLRVRNTYKNHYNKWLFNLVFVGEAFDTNDITRVYIAFPANHLANVLTNKTKRHRKIHNSIVQLNKPKQLNTTKHNKQKLTLIWSYSYDPRSGNEVAPFGDHKSKKLDNLDTRFFEKVKF